jgi:hypothetical protein
VNWFFLWFIEVFSMPQPPSQQPSLSSGQQFMNGPLHLLLHGPFIHPMHLCIPLHFQCKLLHTCSYLFKLFFFLNLAFLLVILSLTTPLAFSSHPSLKNLTGSSALAHLDFHHFLHTLQQYLQSINTMSSSFDTT